MNDLIARLTQAAAISERSGNPTCSNIDQRRTNTTTSKQNCNCLSLNSAPASYRSLTYCRVLSNYLPNDIPLLLLLLSFPTTPRHQIGAQIVGSKREMN